MGKMKELFMQQMEEQRSNMSDAEYQDWLHSQGHKPVTQEEKQSNHDDWWNSLTDEQKQHLFEEQEAMEKERIEREMDEIQYIEDRMDIEDEMNHDLGFGK